METAEKVSLNMEEVGPYVMLQGLVRIHLKESMAGTPGIPVMVENGEMEEVTLVFQVLDS